MTPDVTSVTPFEDSVTYSGEEGVTPNVTGVTFTEEQKTHKDNHTL